MASLAARRTVSEASAAQRRPHDHAVQFYDDDDFLSASVATFVGAGLANGQAVVIIATEEHREAFRRALLRRGLDVDAACSSGQMVLRNARETLAAFLIDGTPDWELFQTQVGGLVAKAASRSKGEVRAYGEMVDLLWTDGRPQEAIVLEQFWNDLRGIHSFTLLCAYGMGNFSREADGPDFHKVCGLHSRALPAESYPREADLDVQLAEVSRLQQRARALEHEIERRKQAEEELRKSREELERQNKDLLRTVRFSEMFVGILGHDLRNPLSAITTAASLLMRRAETDKVARPATRILSSAGRMARMIDQLLDFTRIRLGQGLPLARSANDLAEVCQTAADELDGDPRRIELHASGDTAGAWDGDRLLQLVSNLVGNALAHGARTAPVAVTVDGKRLEEVTLTVENAGAIPPEILHVIFEPFRSGKDRKEDQSSGLGLGLYISHEIVLAHSGSIEVRSTQEEGTRFTVRLPRG